VSQEERLRELDEKIRQAEAEGDIKSQVDYLEEAVKLARELYGTGSNRHIELQSEYGGLLKYVGRPGEAVEQLVEVTKLLEPGEDPLNYATALVNLAGACRFARDLEKSEALYLEARELVKGEDYLYASICNNLGILYQDQRRYEEAKEQHRKSKELLKKDSEHREEYLTTLGNLAAVCLAEGKYDESEALLDEAEEQVRAFGWTEQTLYASLLNQKAALYYHMGKCPEALKLFRTAYDICEKKLGRKSEACMGIERSIRVVEESLKKGS
jgi:tetratricopeptide (TPR) repeat protein